MIYSRPDGLPGIRHSPGSAVVEYSFDWSKWLGTATIVSTSFAVDSPLAVSAGTVVGRETRATVSGAGVLGAQYMLRNTVVTSDGRTDTRVLMLECQWQ